MTKSGKPRTLPGTMIRPILTVPDLILRQKSSPVSDPTQDETKSLIQDLKDSCIAAAGIGLAAPQIGIGKRLIVIQYPQGSPYVLINPEITWLSKGTSILEEGCLSVPGTIVPVSRPKKVKFRALDERGRTLERTASDLLAKILQHEIDHLNGILITDYQIG